MNAEQFLESKGIKKEQMLTTFTIDILLAILDEYAAQATTKIDVSKEFVNLTTKYEEGKNGK